MMPPTFGIVLVKATELGNLDDESIKIKSNFEWKVEWN